MDDETREALVRAWQIAAIELGIRVTAPFRLASDGGRIDLPVIALVHDFGGPAGAIVRAMDDAMSPQIGALASSLGYFVSHVNPESYKQYDRETFIATLNDWQYLGPGPAPWWYTGEPWTR